MERSTSPPALTILPARPRSCPVFDEVLSFKQRKKVPKEAPQGTDGSLTSSRGFDKKNDQLFSHANWKRIFPGWKCWTVLSFSFRCRTALKCRSKQFYRRTG